MPSYEHFEFFPGVRRKLELQDWKELMNAQSEKRIRFDLLMPLTGQAVVGMPGFISAAYEKMDVEGSAIDEVKIDTELEGVTFEAFSTDTAKKHIPIDTLGLELQDEHKQLGRHFVKFSSATIRNFKLVRVSRNKEAIVGMEFNITVKSDAGLVLWAHHYHGGTFWATFTETQPTVPPKSDDNQLRLGDTAPAPSSPAPEQASTKAGAKDEVHLEDCPFARGGEKCILNAEHDGPHQMAPITQDPTARQKKSRSQKEKEAVEAGRPRGLVQ